MNRLIPSAIVAAVTLISAPALAQDFSFYDPDGDGSPNWLLGIDDVSDYSRSGTGSPTVVFDGTEYVMYFESRISEEYLDTLGAAGNYEGCRNREDRDRVVWGIGRATSPNGIDWTADPDPVLLPQEGTFFHCQSAQPNVVFLDGTYHLYFKAQQVWEKHLPEGGSAWGSSRFTGIGYARSTDGVSFTVPDTDPILPVSEDLGFPSVTRVQVDGDSDPVWFLHVALNPEIFLATAPAPGGPYTFFAEEGDERTPILQPGQSLWTDDLVFNPSALCEPTSTTFPFTMFVGGRDLDSEGEIVSAGWGKASAEDARTSVDWFLSANSPYFSWAGAESWRHWEAARIGDADYVLYFSEKDLDGKLQVSFVYSDADSWASTDFGGKICD